GAKAGRSRARPLLLQRYRHGARRPYVGGVFRPRPRQHVLLHPAVARGARCRSARGGSRMRRHRLLGIGCALVALALALGSAVSPARAQLLPPPPVILPPPPVILPPPPASIQEKIDPALLTLMAADPQKLLPVIVEMQQPLPPFIGAPNVGRALEAL